MHHRHSIAEYIAKHAKGVFKLLVADEVHQFQAKASDRGVAFHQLVTACKSTLTLTGTFFGGKSTSIFWLLHRLNAGVQRDFAFQDEKRWARLYGVLETQRRRRRDEDDDDGCAGYLTHPPSFLKVKRAEKVTLIKYHAVLSLFLANLGTA